MHKTVPLLSQVMLFLFILVLTALPARGGSDEQGMSSADTLYVKGLVRSVTAADNTLTIRPNKGKKITVIVDPLTEFKGFYKLEDLEKRQIIEVWYRPGPTGNTAIKIVRPMELGC